MCKTIKHKVKFQAPSEAVYRLLVDSKSHSAFSGKRASLSKKIGGSFSLASGKVSGVIVDLLPGKRVVQAWRASNFPEGIFSMATFLLTPTRGGGTELVLIHRGVPKELIPAVEQNWKESYWKKMKAFLSESQAR